MSQGGEALGRALPALLLANPADAFRLYNLGASEATAAAAGLGGAAATIPLWQALASLVLWPLVTLGLATAAFRLLPEQEGEITAIYVSDMAAAPWEAPGAMNWIDAVSYTHLRAHET